MRCGVADDLQELLTRQHAAVIGGSAALLGIGGCLANAKAVLEGALGQGDGV